MLFIVLLIQGNAYAEILDLGNGVKINVPSNFEYSKSNHESDWIYTAKTLRATEKQIEEEKKLYESLGFSGAEKSIIIGKKGIVKGYVSYQKHLREGKNIKTWEEYSRINKACKNEDSLTRRLNMKLKKDRMLEKCRRKELFVDPSIRIIKADEVSAELMKTSKFFDQPVNKVENKEIEEFKKRSGHVFDKYNTEKITEEYSIKKKTKIVIIGDKWFLETSSKLVLQGIKSKGLVFSTVLNDRYFSISSQCVSRKSCKNIDQLMLNIIDQSFSLETTKIKKFDTNKKEEMIKMFNTVKNGYRYYKLAKFLILLL
jgi:hypothetical protein